MDGCGNDPFECAEMSPGLDGWRLEQHCGSSWRDSVHPCRSRSRSPDHTYGQREGLPEDRENAQGQGPLERVSKIDESLTIDRVKAMRSFKFALVEYVKDLIKPHWKEGKISKDAHKVIVKKSVNKVIDSFRESQVPLGGKIDDYLKSSHSKLSKLVQAYVEKYQKS